MFKFLFNKLGCDNPIFYDPYICLICRHKMSPNEKFNICYFKHCEERISYCLSCSPIYEYISNNIFKILSNGILISKIRYVSILK